MNSVVVGQDGSTRGVRLCSFHREVAMTTRILHRGVSGGYNKE